MSTPLLLLSPDGSRDRAGVVTPTSGGTVTVVAGQYGNAWQFASGSGGYLLVPHANHVSPAVGTIAARIRPNDSADSSRYAIAVGSQVASTEWARIHVDSTESVRATWKHGSDALINSAGVAANAAQWDVAVMDWTGTTFNIRLLIKGLTGAGTRTAPYATIGGSDLTIGALSNGGTSQLDGLIESVLIFDRVLTSSELARLAQPRRWTWDILDRTPRRGLMLPR